MRMVLRSLVFLAVLTGFAGTSRAEGWRGIVPLQSTRADVIKILGEPQHLLWDYRDYFYIENGFVTFTWVDPACLRKYPIQPDAAIQPEDLVLRISVTFTRPVPEKKLNLPKGRCGRPFQGRSWFDSWFCYVTNDDDNFEYHKTEAGVSDLLFEPPVKTFKAWSDSHGACKYEPINHW